MADVTDPTTCYGWHIRGVGGLVDMMVECGKKKAAVPPWMVRGLNMCIYAIRAELREGTPCTDGQWPHILSDYAERVEGSFGAALMVLSQELDAHHRGARPKAEAAPAPAPRKRRSAKK